jgi:hypothetical protein
MEQGEGDKGDGGGGAKTYGPVSHGSAVAYGIAVALRLSERLYGFPEDESLKAQRLCLRLAGGSFPPLPSEEEALTLLLADKKIRDGKIKYVLLKEPGVPAVKSLGEEDFEKMRGLFPEGDFPDTEKLPPERIIIQILLKAASDIAKEVLERKLLPYSVE